MYLYNIYVQYTIGEYNGLLFDFFFSQSKVILHIIISEVNYTLHVKKTNDCQK